MRWTARRGGRVVWFTPAGVECAAAAGCLVNPMTRRTDEKAMSRTWSGRTVVLTGGTGGLGRHLVAQFVEGGATVVLVVRDRRRAQAVVSALDTAGGQVEIEQADLGSQASVRDLAERLAARSGIAVLVNNAGAIFAERRLGPDGVERSVAVNHLGPFLLTTLLMPALRQNTPAAVVNLSTGSVQFGDLDDLQSERRYSPNRSYGTAKLAALAAAVELSRRLSHDGANAVRVVSVDPGAMRTGLGEDIPGLFGFFNRRLKPNQQPIDRTAATIIRAASDASIGTGVWLDLKGRPKKLPRAIRDRAVQRREFDRVADLLGIVNA